MPGSRMRVAERASSKKRCTIVGCTDSSGSSTLIAAGLPSTSCSASHTVPIPPAPICDTTRYLPSTSPITSPHQVVEAELAEADRAAVRVHVLEVEADIEAPEAHGRARAQRG